jgi:anaerobic selenocysteine-containing dehydrogenase
MLISTLVERLKAAGPDRSFFYASGRASNEAGFLFQMLARLFGTNYVNNCSYYCHQASGVGLGMSIGTGAGTVRLEDLQHTDLYHPDRCESFVESSATHAIADGDSSTEAVKIIVINPLKELGLESFKVPSDVRSLLFGTPIASQYVQPHIGGDLALLTGIAKDVTERIGHDEQICGRTHGRLDDFLKSVQETTWDAIVAERCRSRNDSKDRRSVLSGEECRHRLVHGDYSSSAWNSQRSRHRQSGTPAWHGRTDERGPDADSRT